MLYSVYLYSGLSAFEIHIHSQSISFGFEMAGLQSNHITLVPGPAIHFWVTTHLLKGNAKHTAHYSSEKTLSQEFHFHLIASRAQ